MSHPPKTRNHYQFILYFSINKKIKKKTLKKPYSFPLMHVDIGSFHIHNDFEFIPIYIHSFPLYADIDSFHIHNDSTIFLIWDHYLYFFFKLNYTCDCCIFFCFVQEKLHLYFSFVNTIFYHYECFIFFPCFLESLPSYVFCFVLYVFYFVFFFPWLSSIKWLLY